MDRSESTIHRILDRARRAFLTSRSHDDGVSVVPLGSAPVNGCLEIVSICGVVGSEVRRLCEMGLTTGCQLQLLRRSGPAEPILIQVGESRISVTHEVADHFMVASRPAPAA